MPDWGLMALLPVMLIIGTVAGVIVGAFIMWRWG